MNFTIDELCHSATAMRHGITNKPTPAVEYNLTCLIKRVLQPVRELWGHAVTVNSGYRCERLNAIVGGSKNSQHKYGKAADITVGSTELNRKLFAMIRASKIPYDQLIDEYDYKWIHISYDPNKQSQRGQVLHLK